MLEVCTEFSGSNAIVVNVFCIFGYVQTFGKGTPEKDWRTKLVELQQNFKKKSKCASIQTSLYQDVLIIFKCHFF